ncbi:hypothetical protein LJR074_003442 [Acidovorax sp. LjRoot74]|uniref:hypothetical protein n=1 Tax=Acidovorax sp. LjRoot74 TaxID=3342337 RepID=UPI003ECF5C7A
MKKLLLIAALLPLLANAQQEEQAFKVGDCYRAVWSDARAAPVVSRLGVGQSPIPLALRASKAKANKQEQQSLEFVADALQNCQSLDQPNRVNYHPLAKQAVDAFETGYRAILTRAYSGDLTWGAVIEANDANQAAFDKRIGELSVMAEAQRKANAEQQAMAAAHAEEQRKAALRADFDRQQRAEEQQRQIERARQEQANREIANGLLLLQMARPQPAVNCRSTRFFDTVNTTCY